MKRFELNHEGKTLQEITGVSKEVAETTLHKKPYTDLGFAIGIILLINKVENGGFLLSLIMAPLLDKEFEHPSDIVEHIVNEVHGETRKKMVDTIHEAIFVEPNNGVRVEVIHADTLEVIHADTLEDALDQIKRKVHDEHSGK